MRRSLQLVVGGKPFTQNDQRRLTPFAVRSAKQGIETAVYQAIAEQHGGYAQMRKGSEGWQWPCMITVQDHCRTANLRDIDACAPTVKVIIDVLVDIGVLPDDTPAFVGALTFCAPTKTGTNEIIITITEEIP